MEKDSSIWPANPFRRFSAPRSLAERLEDEAWFLADNFLIAKEIASLAGEPGHNAERSAVSKIEGFRTALLAIDNADTDKILLLFAVLMARIRDKELTELYNSEHFYLGAKYLQYYEALADPDKNPVRSATYEGIQGLESSPHDTNPTHAQQDRHADARTIVPNHERSGERTVPASLQMRAPGRDRSYRLYSNGLLRRR